MKNFHPRQQLSSQKLIFFSNLSGKSDPLCKLLSKNSSVTVIKMEEVFARRIKENGLYAELIESFNKIGKPVSGIVAAKVLFDELIAHRGSNKIFVDGFPNSPAQLQSWEEEVG